MQDGRHGAFPQPPLPQMSRPESEKPDDDLAATVLFDAPGHLLRRAYQVAEDLYAQEVGEAGPTPRQHAVLLTVYQNRGLNQQDLGRLTGIDRSTMTEMVGRLVKRGWLSRRRTRHDQRAYALDITEVGRAVLIDSLDAVQRAQARILAPLPPTRRAEFIDCLRSLAGTGRKDG